MTSGHLSHLVSVPLDRHLSHLVSAPLDHLSSKKQQKSELLVLLIK